MTQVLGMSRWLRTLGPALRAGSQRLGRRAAHRHRRPAPARMQYPPVATCGTADEVLAHSDVQTVVISTPATSHAALVCRALDERRHVLAEKPMALDRETCDALRDRRRPPIACCSSGTRSSTTRALLRQAMALPESRTDHVRPPSKVNRCSPNYRLADRRACSRLVRAVSW